MDSVALKEAITKLGGPEYVLSFTYDNAGRVMFNSKSPFTMDMIDGEFIRVEELSLESITTVGLKPIETIQTILGVKNPEDRDKIDPHYFRS